MMAKQDNSKLASKFITLCYDNFPIQREFVFAIKGRPFSMLSNNSLPVPSTSLIDFNLVNDLGLKMSDLQCAKFSFGGQRLRILGRISQTVQTITDGVISGTVHIRANVVEDLRKTFDCHSIAGKKMTEMLSREIPATVSPPASPTPSATSLAEQSPAPSKSSRRSRGSRASATTKTSVSAGAPDTSGSPRAAAGSWSPSASSTASTPSPGRLSPPPGFTSTQVRAVRQEPLVPFDKPPPGYVRNLQLKPDNNRYRSWHQGRVVELIHHSNGLHLAEVDVLRTDDDPLKDDDNVVFTEFCQYPGLNVAVNDVVLFRDHDTTPGLSYEEGRSCIRVVYNEEEVGHLQSHGVKIPECPPEKLPNGYYG